MVRLLLPLLALALLISCAKPQPPVDMTSTSSIETSSASSVELLTGKHQVILRTSQGDIALELDADLAPKTVTNFVTHAKNGYYDNLTFHRVIPGFMIQGGDPSGNGTGGESIFGETFEDEIDASKEPYLSGYKKGIVAMANAGPDTNGSQFFIMEAEQALSPDYTIFGNVTTGQDIVSKIAKVPRDGADKPLTPVTFKPEVRN